MCCGVCTSNDFELYIYIYSAMPKFNNVDSNNIIYIYIVTMLNIESTVDIHKNNTVEKRPSKST